MVTPSCYNLVDIGCKEDDMWEYVLDGRIVTFDGKVVEHFPERGASVVLSGPS